MPLDFVPLLIKIDELFHFLGLLSDITLECLFENIKRGDQEQLILLRRDS